MHCYTKDGKPVYEVDGKSTGLRQLRKLDLVPSVTEIIKTASNYGLIKYKIDQAIDVTKLNPDWDKDKIITESRKTSLEAADWGTAMHSYISWRLTKKNVCPGLVFAFADANAEYVIPVIEYLDDNEFKGESEITGANDLYGGAIDFNGTTKISRCRTLVDFKTQKTGGASKRIRWYPSWGMQLAAYGSLCEAEEYANVVISSTEPGRIEHKIWSKKDIIRLKKAFDGLVQYYYAMNKLGEWNEKIQTVKK